MADTYLDFWNLTQPMFMDSPFGEGLYVTEQMQWIQEQLLMESRGSSQAFAISGESGVGKSRLLEWLYKDLPIDGYEVAYWSVVRKRPLNKERFLIKLAGFFGIDDFEYSAETEKKLCDCLEELSSQGQTLVVLIDACEHLNFEEDLKSLSNLIQLLNAANVKHTFALSGSKGFLELVEKHHELMPKNIQILLLHKLTKYEMMDFVQSVCKRSGVPTQAFDKDAVDLLFEQTQGNFKLVCLLLEACLNMAYQKNVKKVHKETLLEVLGIANDELNHTQQQLKASA